MNTINIHEAKTHLSRLVDKAAKGESFVIAKAGKPMARVAALDKPVKPQRLGFMAGEFSVPDDFDRMGAAAIMRAFGGAEKIAGCRTSLDRKSAQSTDVQCRQSVGSREQESVGAQELSRGAANAAAGLAGQRLSGAADYQRARGGNRHAAVAAQGSVRSPAGNRQLQIAV